MNASLFNLPISHPVERDPLEKWLRANRKKIAGWAGACRACPVQRYVVEQLRAANVVGVLVEVTDEGVYVYDADRPKGRAVTHWDNPEWLARLIRGIDDWANNEIAPVEGAVVLEILDGVEVAV